MFSSSINIGKDLKTIHNKYITITLFDSFVIHKIVPLSLLLKKKKKQFQLLLIKNFQTILNMSKKERKEEKE